MQSKLLLPALPDQVLQDEVLVEIPVPVAGFPNAAHQVLNFPFDEQVLLRS
jgi:hypothetical protein